MQSLNDAEVVGFVELKVGSLAVQVPIRVTDPADELPLASFETDGEAFAILVRGDATSSAVATALRDAAHDAVRHLSRKLLN
jgi:hypothetical protein